MNVADLLRRAGTTRDVHVEVPGEGWGNGVVTGAAPVTLDLRLEGLAGSVVATGHVRGSWTASCSRCLGAVEAAFEVALREVFAPGPVGDETYPLGNDEIDLSQPLRDVVVPALPTVPLCRPDCAGLCPDCGANRNDTAACGCGETVADRRWDALGKVEF